MRFCNAFLISMFLFGCQNKTPDSGKKESSKQKISLNIESEPQTLDPRKARSLGDINLTRTFMDGLMRIGKEGKLEFAIAENCTLSEDKKTYLFHLRDTKWSNNDPVKAQDFVYTWKKALSPEFLSDYTFLLYFVKNAKSVKEGLLPSSMLGVSAKDDYTLSITLEKPTPFFLELLSLPIFFAVNQTIDQTEPNWHRNASSYVGNGPFKLMDWKHNDAITAIKNDLYWDASAVHLNTLQMIMVSAETGLKMFENHELDWSGSPYSTIPVDAIIPLKNLVKADPLLGTYWIRTNTTSFPLNNTNLRKALALAINREDIVTHVTNGFQKPATGIVPVSMGLQNVPYFTDGSQDEARDLLQLAIERESLSKETFPDLTLMYAADARNHRIAQAIQDQWKKTLEIDVKLESVEPKVCFDRISKGSYQMAIGSWIADFKDPINFLEVFKNKSIGTNNTNWESLNYQKALEETYLANTSYDRMISLQKSEQILMDEMPVIPIFHYTMLHVNNDHLKDVVLTDSGHIDFKWAYVEN